MFRRVDYRLRLDLDQHRDAASSQFMRPYLKMADALARVSAASRQAKGKPLAITSLLNADTPSPIHGSMVFGYARENACSSGEETGAKALSTAAFDSASVLMSTPRQTVDDLRRKPVI
jgi:hypothetical protein